MPPISIKLNRNILLITAIACAIFIGGLLLLHTASLTAKDKIADGLLADFVITFPVFYYFIIIRPAKTSARKILLVISVCLAIAYVVLPQHQREYILQIRKLTAVAELAFIIYAFTKFAKIKQAYQANAALMPDPVYNLRAGMAVVLGDSLAVKIIASELAVLRYSLLCWRKEETALKESTSFSTHREFGYIAIWCMLLVAVMVEVTAFHLLLMRWSTIAAWIVTVLSLYGVIFFIADLSAILKRKVLIGNEQIVLRTGLRWRINTPSSNIGTIKKISNDYQSADEYFKGGIIKNSGNLLITFKQPVMVDKLYGSSKAYYTLLMHIDNFESFANAIEERR